MKSEASNEKSLWAAGAAQDFAHSPIGAQVVHLLRTGSRSQRALSEFILRDPVFVATHGIEDVARASGISGSTISRYVRDLGFVNYALFRAQLADCVHALMAPVAKLERRLAGGAGAHEAPAATQSFEAAQTQLAALADAGTRDAVMAAARILLDARQIWVMGFGLSAHLAALLALGLQPYRESVFNVVQYGGTEVAAARLVGAGPGDVVVALTFPRYSRDLPGLCAMAQKAGARIVALTDSPAAPIAQTCDHLLLAPAGHPVLPSSCLPGLAVIEALLAEFLLLDPAHLLHAERLAAMLSTYLFDPPR